VRACWVTQRLSGLAVTPARCTRLVSCSMKNSTSSRRNRAGVIGQRVGHGLLRLPERRVAGRQVFETRRKPPVVPARSWTASATSGRWR
jgi:hypothetical protein